MDADLRYKNFELLLSGLSALDDDGLLNQVYSLALKWIASEHDLRLMAEAVHQRWLSDPSFPPVAAALCYQLAHLHDKDISFSSIVLGIIMNDYKDRAGLRRSSRTLFCNSVYFSFEFYFLFRNEGPIFQTLIQLNFDYLQMLLDKDTSDGELSLFHHLMCLYGDKMSNNNARKTRNLILTVRQQLVDSKLGKRLRAKLLQLIDLEHVNWRKDNLTDTLREFYVERRTDASTLCADTLLEIRHRVKREDTLQSETESHDKSE